MPDNQRILLKNTSFASKVLSTGLTGGICLALSLYFGYQFDLYFATQPIGILSGIFFGLLTAMLQTWKQLRESLYEFDKHKNKSKKE